MFIKLPLGQDRTVDTPKGVCPCPSGFSIIGLDKCPILSGQCPVLITRFCWNMMNSITKQVLEYRSWLGFSTRCRSFTSIKVSRYGAFGSFIVHLLLQLPNSAALRQPVTQSVEAQIQYPSTDSFQMRGYYLNQYIRFHFSSTQSLKRFDLAFISHVDDANGQKPDGIGKS